MKTKVIVRIIVAVVCVLILLTSVLVMVAAQTRLDAQIESEIVEQINQKQQQFDSKYNPITDFDLYYTSYGKVNGYVVYYTHGTATVVTTIDVAGFEFTKSSAFTITCYKDGQFVLLQDAYEQGLFSKFDVFVVWMRYVYTSVQYVNVKR